MQDIGVDAGLNPQEAVVDDEIADSKGDNGEVDEQQVYDGSLDMSEVLGESEQLAHDRLDIESADGVE